MLFRPLAFNDPTSVADASLRSVVRKKLFCDPTPSKCADFLNGRRNGYFARESENLSSQWPSSQALSLPLEHVHRAKVALELGVGILLFKCLSIPQCGLRASIVHGPGCPAFSR
ncbi:hypothetical protein NPIL_636521 [Nephila pilipes]|uniref:Uncharacterized protein n=1 Tax=Nephila pilipes TaxID=299642 RepID=A0A8X6PBA5_NEPPI|nr:hypothetical protein NPIL_636521 [Nephila pilipes]